LARVLAVGGQLLGIAKEGAPRAQLAAARRDAVLRGAQVTRALCGWLRAEGAAYRVILSVDGSHWGDWGPVPLIAGVLRRLAEYPLVVLALARPEIHELFPRLWAKRGATELRLSGLSRRSASEMIEEVLGPAVGKSVLDR